MLALGAARGAGAPRYQGFAYNDNDATTGYDVQMPLQLAAFDPYFHWNDMCYQPPRFAFMDDLYPMFNGRGYPDTVNTDPDPASNVNAGLGHRLRCADQSRMKAKATPDGDPLPGKPSDEFARHRSPRTGRPSSGSTASPRPASTRSNPPGSRCTVVGRDARIFRGGGVPSGLRREYLTNSVTLGGGESIDVILDTTGIQPGTYFLYSRELDHLNNNQDRRGGMMTEIRVTP